MNHRYTLVPSVFSVVCLALTAQAASNSVTITELTGSAQTGRPFTISRVFAQGEIANYAQPRLNGSAASVWQVDAKTRWPDGSLQHALVSFKASLAAGGTLVVDFVNNPNPCSSGSRAACDAAGLTQTQLLDFDAGGGTASWGARIQATASSITKTADARVILAAGNYSYWLRGPVVTQVIIEDRSTNLAYDFGWQCTSGCTTDYASSTWVDAPSDSYRSLHPIFVATFYPGYAGVKVEYIVENTWANRLQDQRYSYTLSAGNPAATTVATSGAINHWAQTRWRQTFWNGKTPGVVKIDYNLPYMVQSKALPSFDLTKKVTSAGIDAQLTRWAASDKGAIMGDWVSGSSHRNGLWLKYFPTTGGREDVGLFPTWVVRYLYTFHTTADGNDLYNVMLGNAAVSGHIPIHIRHADTSTSMKYCALSALCTKAGLDTVPVFGRTPSRDAYPTAGLAAPVATRSSSHNWSVDVAHQGSYAYVPYLITGDWYWLDELNFWSGLNLMRYTSGTTLNYHSHNDWCYIKDQVRGNAWGYRNLAHAAFMNPDGTPEKAYFTQKLLNNIAIREGRHDIRDGYGYAGDNVKWQWGYTRASAVDGNKESTTHVANPLNFLDYDPYATLDGMDTTKVRYVTSQWMVHYMCVVLAHLEDLGFPVTKYKEALYKHNINQLLNPAYNPWLISEYRTPVVSALTGGYISTWADMKAGYTAAEQARTTWASGAGDVEHGYAFIARAAAQFYDGVNDGPYLGSAARAWFTGKLDESLLNENPKWAFTPRSAASAAAPGACDLDGDGTVSVSDVQLSISKALGSAACGTGDLDGDGQCTVVDTQRVINAVLGSSCRTGS